MRRCLVFVLMAAVVFSLVISSAAAGPIFPEVYHTLHIYETTEEKTAFAYLDALFVPLGWSHDGKLAYAVETINEAAGFGEFAVLRWVIQDMVTDKVLWESGWEFESELPKSLWEAGTEQIFEWEYLNLLPEYQSYFDRYGIIPDKDIKFLRFPLQHDGGKYRGFIAGARRGEQYGIPDMLQYYEVAVARDGKAKTVARFDEKFLVDAQVAGYVKSPYEPRIAVIVCEVPRGWEGPPHPVDCVFVGCHLEKGY